MGICEQTGSDRSTITYFWRRAVDETHAWPWEHNMSWTGNCLDNAVMENFFGLLKSELLYLQEFDSLEHFKTELIEYYYNNRLIKEKLKGLLPALHRKQALFVTWFYSCLTFWGHFRLALQDYSYLQRSILMCLDSNPGYYESSSLQTAAISSRNNLNIINDRDIHVHIAI